MTVARALERALHLEAVARIEEEEQVPKSVQKLSGTADGNSRESGGNCQCWVNTRRGYQEQKIFNQNQGRPNSLENEKSEFPNNDKTFNGNFNNTCTRCGQKGHRIKQCRVSELFSLREFPTHKTVLS